MSLYLDNAAAAPCTPELLSFFAECAACYPGNQESMGWHGANSSKAVFEAGEKICAAFHAPAGFHSQFLNTGTGALAVAVEAACMEIRKGNVVSTTLEHPALEQALIRSCKAHNLELKLCRANRNGVDMEQFSSLLNKDTALVAVHHVQSETGGILDLKQIRELMDTFAPRAVLLVDTMQSACKLPLPFHECRPDFVFVSGQKIGAPGGAALLCGNQWKTVRSLRSRFHFGGRCMPAMCLTLSQAIQNAMFEQTVNYKNTLELRDSLLQALEHEQIGFTRTIPNESSSPFIVHILTVPCQGAILTRALHQYEISIAPGSACESETPSGSRALSAMGYSDKESFCGLRISFWRGHTKEDMSVFAEKLRECIQNY